MTMKWPAPSLLIDPSNVFVIGLIHYNTSGSTTKSTQDAKKAAPKDKKRATPSKSSGYKEDLQAHDQKWSERLSQLEALIIAKSLEKPTDEPTFQSVKVSLVKQPPARVVALESVFMTENERYRSPIRISVGLTLSATYWPTDQPTD